MLDISMEDLAKALDHEPPTTPTIPTALSTLSDADIIKLHNGDYDIVPILWGIMLERGIIDNIETKSE